MIRPLLLSENTTFAERLEMRIFERDVAAGLVSNLRLQCIKELDGEIIGVAGSSDVDDTNPIVRNLERIDSFQTKNKLLILFFMSVQTECSTTLISASSMPAS